jgi:hypothetical protein
VAQVYSQFAAQEQTGSVQSSLHGGNRESNHAGDLLIRHAFEIAKDDNAFIQRFQLVQSIRDQSLHFVSGILLIERVGPIHHWSDKVVPIFLKFGQILFVFDLFVPFAPANLSKGGVNGETVKPSRKLGISLERFCFAVDCPEDILNDLFSVGDVA